MERASTHGVVTPSTTDGLRVLLIDLSVGGLAVAPARTEVSNLAHSDAFEPQSLLEVDCEHHPRHSRPDNRYSDLFLVSHRRISP